MMKPNRRAIVAASVLLAVFFVGIALFVFEHREMVGDYDLNIPGAKVMFQDNGTSAGNLKEYTVQGKKTKIHVVLDNTLSYKGKVGLADVKAQMDSFLATQKTVSSGPLKDIVSGTLNSSQIQGYYQFADLTNTRRQSIQQRNLFFLRGGKPYQVTFWFTETGLDSDDKLASKTWQMLLDNLGIPTNAFPVAR